MYTVTGDRLEQYKVARPTLTVFAVITLALMLTTIAMCTWCTINFNKGLKAHVNKRSKADAESDQGKWAMDDVPAKSGSAGGPNPNYAAGGSRMEID